MKRNFKIPYKEVYGGYRTKMYPLKDTDDKGIDYFNPEDEDEEL